jgi:predicted HTH transcriptional regulator
MTHHKVDLLELAKRESATVEWKENVADVSNVISTMVAFANIFLNLGGGYIVCGAKEIKDAFGFQSVEYVGLTAPRYLGDFLSIWIKINLKQVLLKPLGETSPLREFFSD